ncbi:CHY zinc finger domain protein [Aspergillus heterothallicus]
MAGGTIPTSRNNAGHRPISQSERSDPREFQLNQLRRRFRPTETTDDSGTTLSFGMAPSDPDFPFELQSLECVLKVPTTYPACGRPSLKVANPEMGADFQENISRGFDDIVDSALRMGGRETLLNWINSLDRHLERLLTTIERGPTLKFVPNAGRRDGDASRHLADDLKSLTVSHIPERKPESRAPPAVKTRPVYTAEERFQAEKRRAVETKQLEARLGRLPLFQKARDGQSFVISIQPTKVDRLPMSIRPVKTIKLSVPQLYPLEHSSIELLGVLGMEAVAVEVGFSQWLNDHLQLNLVSQINYLASNIHNFAKTLVEAPEPEQPESEPPIPEVPQPPAELGSSFDDDKPHLHIIQRPPEWTIRDDESGSKGTDISTTEDEFSDDEEDGGAAVPFMAEPTTEHGVALSFPFLELYGIELLELVGLYITVKCDRCKEPLDVRNIPQTKDSSGALSPKIETCKKCSNSMSLGFRRLFMHPNANRAGYLDLDGCTIVDLLPSGFIPTCAECSTSFPGPGVVAVRGESAMANCRQCHRKMVFNVPEVKFLKVGSAAFTSRDRAPTRRKPKEVLGIVAGQELPRRGRCIHYGKSYRWFRFSCCSKVYPCDKCHDADTDHPNEHANRMICGFCSREQIYRPENCGICRSYLIGKAGSGFWEGGKGTRNKTLMSRKDLDPRKYKRRGGTTPGGASSSKKK